MANFKVLLSYGQSNTSGAAALSGYTSTQLTEKSKFFVFEYGAVYNLKAGVNNRRNAIVSQAGGYEIELSTQIEDNYSGYVIMLKMDRGSTGIADEAGQNGSWNSTRTTSPYNESQFMQAIIQIDLFEKFFTKNLAPLGHTYTYSAMIWNQGEQDGGNEARANAYEVNCSATWTALKTKVGVANLPIYDFTLSDLLTTSTTYKNIINIAKQNLRTAHANGGVIYNTDAANGYAFGDAVHFDAPSYTLMGSNLYRDLTANGHL